MVSGAKPIVIAFMVKTLVGQHGAFELLCGDGLVGQVFGQDFAGAGMAFAAAGRHAEVAAQFGHRAQAQVDGLTDFTIRYVVADTYNHRYTFWLKKRGKIYKKN
jgi:hypothetical protein